MKTFKIGLVGCGFMGKSHTFGYKTIPLYYENLPFKINLKTDSCVPNPYKKRIIA